MPTIPSPSATAASTAETRSTSSALAWTPCRNTSARASRVPLGVYRGLHFGLTLDPQFAPEVYLEGAITRRSPLSREHHGPRAVLNALERLAGGYGSECSRVRQRPRHRGIPAPRLQGPPRHALPARRLPGRADRLTRPAQGRPFRGDCRSRAPTHRRPLPNSPSGSRRSRPRTPSRPHRNAPENASASAEEPVTARIRRREQEAEGEWQRRVSERRGEAGGEGIKSDGQSGVPALPKTDEP